MSFAQLNLNPVIFKALKSCGYDKPTPIQERSIPEVLRGKDLVASAQTGTGKTAAFILPVLHYLCTEKNNGSPLVLILTPTRELANQITQAAKKYSRFSPCNIASLVGGMPYGPQIKELSRKVDIVVATPGRLLDLLNRKHLNLSHIKMLVLDEADRMLDMGFSDDVKYIARLLPKKRQTLLFSATVESKNLKQMIQQLLNNPVLIDLSKEKLVPTQIQQEIYMVDSPQHKFKLLQHFLTEVEIKKGIIFSGTKINADRLAKDLRMQGYKVASLHGDLKQRVRERTVIEFRNGKTQFLVATDVAARGIHIPDISHVFNFDLPKFAEDYVHRIGRTGRVGKTGMAISFVLRSDKRHLQQITRYVGQSLPHKVITGLEPSWRETESAKKSKKRFSQKKKIARWKKKPAAFSKKSTFHDGRSRSDASSQKN